MSTFTVLRSLKSLGMDCDVDQKSVVTTIDPPEKDGSVTVYGTVDGNGDLWYIVLSPELIRQIKSL